MGASSSAGAIEWSVELPARGSTLASGAMRPTATLVVGAASGEAERRAVPVAVGRALRRLANDALAAPLSRVELLDRVDQLHARCASERVAALINRRDYSSKEVRDRLARDGYPPAVCDEAVGRAVECGLVDDARYADVLIRSKIAGGWGRQRIERELGRRGIDASSVSGWPGDYLNEEDEYDHALAVARTRRVAPKNGYQKLVRYLAGRGFALSLATRVARQVIEERQEDRWP